MPTFDCEKCLPVNVSDDWTFEKKGEIASLIRSTSSITAIQSFQEVNMSLSDAKGIALHVTKENGLCHHCGSNLVKYESKCSKCKRLNLDW